MLVGWCLSCGSSTHLRQLWFDKGRVCYPSSLLLPAQVGQLMQLFLRRSSPAAMLRAAAPAAEHSGNDAGWQEGGWGDDFGGGGGDSDDDGANFGNGDDGAGCECLCLGAGLYDGCQLDQSLALLAQLFHLCLATSVSMVASGDHLCMRLPISD